jgi:hypothetical protein
MNRHQRRATQAINKTAGDPQGSMAELNDGLKEMQAQLTKVISLHRNNYNTIQMIKETLERLGVLKIEDLKETERLYQENAKNKDLRVKEIYKQNLTDDEKIELCLNDILTYKPGYLKQNISPVRDLGVAPNVVNNFVVAKGYVGLKYREYAMYLGVPEYMLSKNVMGQHEQSASV